MQKSASPSGTFAQPPKPHPFAFASDRRAAAVAGGIQSSTHPPPLPPHDAALR